MRDQGRAAAYYAAVDPGVLNVVKVVVWRVRPHDVMNLGVVERQDYTQRLDDGARIRIARLRPIQESLVDVRLDYCEFHAGVVAKMLNVCGRAVGRQDLQRDVRFGLDVFGEIGANREIRAPLVRRDDFVISLRKCEPEVKAKHHRYDRAQPSTDNQCGHVISSLSVGSWCTQPEGRSSLGASLLTTRFALASCLPGFLCLGTWGRRVLHGT